jgi:hypothetical protein
MTLFRRIPASLQLVTLSLLSLAALGLASRSATAGETLAKVKQSGKVTVGTEAAFPPFEFIREGKIVGYDKDILDSAVAGLGVQLEQIDVPWQGLFPGLLAGKFDFIASAMTMYDEPTRKFAFTMPSPRRRFPCSGARVTRGSRAGKISTARRWRPSSAPVPRSSCASSMRSSRPTASKASRSTRSPRLRKRFSPWPTTGPMPPPRSFRPC